MQTNEQVAGEAREKLADKIADVALDLNYSDAAVGIITRCNLPMIVAALRAQPERGADEDERAARRIVSARLAADTDGYGSVDIALQGGRRVLLSLDAPHPAKDEGGATDA